MRPARRGFSFHWRGLKLGEPGVAAEHSIPEHSAAGHGEHGGDLSQSPFLRGFLLLRKQRSRMASISLGRRSSRLAFSANSPLTTSAGSTTVTGTSAQPSCCTAPSRRSPAISSACELMTIGCRRPIGDAARARRCRPCRGGGARGDDGVDGAGVAHASASAAAL